MHFCLLEGRLTGISDTYDVELHEECGPFSVVASNGNPRMAAAGQPCLELLLRERPALRLIGRGSFDHTGDISSLIRRHVARFLKPPDISQEAPRSLPSSRCGRPSRPPSPGFWDSTPSTPDWAGRSCGGLLAVPASVGRVAGDLGPPGTRQALCPCLAPLVAAFTTSANLRGLRFLRRLVGRFVTRLRRRAGSGQQASWAA